MSGLTRYFLSYICRSYEKWLLHLDEVLLMNCQMLAERIQKLEPAATPAEIARLCLLITNSVESMEEINEIEDLTTRWREMSLRVQAGIDQHAAMTQELETLAQSDPEKFSKEDVWVLIRAIKVQSQILQLYLGEPALDV